MLEQFCLFHCFFTYQERPALMLLVIANLNLIMQKQMETCNTFIKDVTKEGMPTHLETVVNYVAMAKITVLLNMLIRFTLVNVYKVCLYNAQIGRFLPGQFPSLE